MSENISNLERLWQADEERRRLGACVPSAPPRPEPSAKERAQAERLTAARALSDSLFLDDAQVQALSAAHEIRLAVSADQHAIRRWLMAERERLTAQISAAEQALAWTVLAAGAQRDGGFALARAELATLASDKALVSAIDPALALLDISTGANQRLADEVNRTCQALNERLFELKLSHIDGAKE